MFKKIYVFLFFLVLSGSCAYSFDICVFPGNPTGGEGMLVRIENTTYPDYTVIFEGKKYASYPRDGKSREIFIPVGIETKGLHKLTVKRKLLFVTLEEQSLDIDVTPRNIANILLKPSDETLRDKQKSIDRQQELVLDSIAIMSKKKFWKNPFILPLKSKSRPNFADRRKGKNYIYFHKGVDLGGKLGTPVCAVNDGIVAFTGNKFNVYGNLVILDHGQGVISCYFHLKKILKKTGDRVCKNEVIAKLGNTGWSTGPHLHFGIYLQGEAVDPLWWVAFSSNVAGME